MLIIISIILLSIVSILFVVYLVFLAPSNKRGESFRTFEEHYIAHRGFFDNESNCPENSLAAFARAVQYGYGVELDVQMTLDKKIVVFHDDNLLRMCGSERKIEECSFEELQQYNLSKSEEKIPLLTDALDIIRGQVPLIVEIKNTDQWQNVTESTAKVLDEYAGCYCVESFNPFIVAWYKKNRPEILRGQLSTDFFKDEPQMSFLKKFVLTNLLLNRKARPDFIAYHHIHKNQISYKLLRKLFRVKNVAWTIRSQQELNDARDVFTCIIFDSFTPNKN